MSSSHVASSDYHNISITLQLCYFSGSRQCRQCFQSSGAALVLVVGQEGNPADGETGRTQDASVLQKEKTQRGVQEETGISAVPGKSSVLMPQCLPANLQSSPHSLRTP